LDETNSNRDHPMNDIDTCRSYATEANMVTALGKLGFAGHRHLVVRNRAGRFSAIFPVSNVQDGDLTRYARAGFMTLG
jgi:hypothetical protein